MDKVIEKVEVRGELPEHVYSNAYISSIIKGAEILFKDLEDIHSKKRLNKVVSRYIKHKDKIERILPKVH